jgi:hypothetical protein
MTEEYNIFPVLPRESDPLNFWRGKPQEGHFLPMVKVVTRFLGTGNFSAKWAAIFIGRGELISESRNRLHPVDGEIGLNKIGLVEIGLRFRTK